MRLSAKGKNDRVTRAKQRESGTAVDLFCGSGGLTLGLKRARFAVLAGVEIDSLSIETYRQNHPEVRLYESDIRLLDPRTVLHDVGLEPGDLDLLAGCPPCQGFSTIRTKNKTTAVEDARNELIFEFLRFAAVFQPKAIMLENVPGLISYDRFDMVVMLLEAIGFRSEFKVQDAADFSVPQRRHRFVLMGSRFGAVPFPSPSRVRPTVRDTIGRMSKPEESRDKLHNVRENRGLRIAQVIDAIPKNGGSRSALPASLQLECHQRSSGFRDVYGRMAWDEVAPTITGGCINPSKGRFLHPSENRSITPREAALLQGFPTRYQFSLRCGKYGAARLIGNAFPPEFARRHAANIAAFLAKHVGREISSR